MLQLVDILHRIASEIYGTGTDPGTDMKRYMESHAHGFRLGITDDVEESEIYYRRKYGPGETFYFHVLNYAHGRHLAAQFYEFFTGQEPDMSNYDGDRFPSDQPLYLFIHVSKAVIQVTVLQPEVVSRYLPASEGFH